MPYTYAYKVIGRTSKYGCKWIHVKNLVGKDSKDGRKIELTGERRVKQWMLHTGLRIIIKLTNSRPIIVIQRIAPNVSTCKISHCQGHDTHRTRIKTKQVALAHKYAHKYGAHGYGCVKLRQRTLCFSRKHFHAQHRWIMITLTTLVLVPGAQSKTMHNCSPNTSWSAERSTFKHMHTPGLTPKAQSCAHMSNKNSGCRHYLKGSLRTLLWC